MPVSSRNILLFTQTPASYTTCYFIKEPLSILVSASIAHKKDGKVDRNSSQGDHGISQKINSLKRRMYKNQRSKKEAQTDEI